MYILTICSLKTLKYKKNQKKDTAEIHLMFTANEEIKEGKFSSKTNILTQDGF